MNNRNWDKFFALASWVIVVALITASVGVFLVEPSGAGPVAGLIGTFGAQIFYSTLYATEAVLLAFAKVTKRNQMRKNVLLAIYFTGIFTSLLTIIGVGLTWSLWDNVTFSVISGACWLYWKFRTEYMTPEQVCSGDYDLPCKDKTK